MKIHAQLKLSAIALAAISALWAMSARADDDEAAALKKPENSIEIGVLGTPNNAAKFGEYSGINKSGAYSIGNVNVRGGSAYEENEEGATERWSIRGTDLGLTSRSMEATRSDQGSWNLGLQYDELQHNLSDSYQTPYLGAMGGNSFSLPTGFPLSTNTNTGTTAITAAQLAAMNIGTTRKNTSLNGKVIVNTQLNYTFDYNHLDQSGAKLMGFGAAAVGGATGQAIAVLPMPTNYKTDTYNLAMNWRDEQAYASMGVSGSVFRDGYSKVGFSTFMGANSTQYMPTAPDNSFSQVNLSGGYQFTPKTKLTGNFSYGGGTQNVPFVTPDAGMMVSPSPVSSLNGVVLNTHADVKVVDQTSRDLALSAGYKYDQRNNQTASNLYNFNAIDGGNTAKYPNTPLSTRKEQFELAGDYRLRQDQNVRVAYVHENIDRWCNHYAYGNGTAYTATTNCVVSKASAEDKVDASYRIKTSDDTTLRVAYVVSDRQATMDPYALAAFISAKGAIPPALTTTNLGQNAGDYYGFYPMFSASRQQQMLKSSLNWQPTEQLELGLTGRYAQDRYPDSTYGAQNGRNWGLSLDASYNYRDNGSVNGYVSQQYRQRDMTNLANNATTAVTATATALGIPAGAVRSWTNTLTDQDLTVGVGVKQGGLMAGKLEVLGDLSYSLGTTGYNTQWNYANATTGGYTCASTYFMSCGQVPEIRTSITRLKLSAMYQVDKSSKFAFHYLQQHMSSSDYIYNGYQVGNTPSSLMPNNLQVGNYSAQVFAASFIHNF